ncbi:MAG: flavin reductase family protein [Candidatus Lokiarchaeota archaeon]|nr:flavin reductase family protein [Candidatus Lokiarchaeota archaeon]MBD3339090.1 flavin reductase family protein [Candidatus Lokiarchaeota archaeon]
MAAESHLFRYDKTFWHFNRISTNFKEKKKKKVKKRFNKPMVKNVKIRTYPYIYPKPISLIGAIVDGKPNFFALADITNSDYNPPRITISCAKNHYTAVGIKDHSEFSVSMPSEEMLKITDYCGLVSGKKWNKSDIFDVYYGELDNAPLINNAPISMGCKLVKTIDFGDTHYIFIGEIIECYAREDCLTEKNKPDFLKMRAIVWSSIDNMYYKVGHAVGKAYKIGRELKKKYQL